MTVALTHRLVGYDKATGRVAFEHAIPPHHLDYARLLARPGRDDPDMVLCYRLDRHQSLDLARAIDADINPDALNYYVEGFAAPSRARA